MLGLIDVLRRGMWFAAALGIAVAANVSIYSRSLTPLCEAQATLEAATQNPIQPCFGITLVTAALLDGNACGIAVSSRPLLADALLVLGGRATVLDRTHDPAARSDRVPRSDWGQARHPSGCGCLPTYGDQLRHRRGRPMVVLLLSTGPGHGESSVAMALDDSFVYA